MNINDCRLHRSASRPGDFPADGFPEIAFMGRSNVGKSSLLNALLGTRGLARTSKAPGRTQAIHFYAVNRKVYFVDLPGYGYARVPREMRRSWQALVESYLAGPDRPDLAVLLVDARHEPTDLDGELLVWLRSRGIRHTVVLTKSDKLSRNERAAAARRAAAWVGEGTHPAPLAVSAVEGDGLPLLWRTIDAAIASSPRGAAPPREHSRTDRELHDRTEQMNDRTNRAPDDAHDRPARDNPYRGGRNTL